MQLSRASPIDFVHANLLLVCFSSQKLKEGSDFYSAYKFNKLICHRLTDSGRRHETPGSRTKNVIIHGSITSMNFMFEMIFLVPQMPQGVAEHRVGLHHSQRTLSLGNAIF